MGEIAEMAELEITDDFQKAFDLLDKSNDHLFISGKAGTGKSTLLQYFRENTEKNIVVLAPTGVASVHIGGQTIHSFFKFKANVTLDTVERLKTRSKKKNIYQRVDAIIIDEISMVRADLMDCIDKFMRLNGRDKNRAFGGAQMIFFGDLYQLPPVVRREEKQIFEGYYQSPYFFDAHVFKGEQVKYVELQKVYRQKDNEFVSVLNAIRHNTITQKQLSLINRRVDPNFKIPKEDIYIHLTPTNKLADEINQKRLQEIDSQPYHFMGDITGSFRNGDVPTQIDLEIKIGAQIMMVNNDPKKRWVNGTMGKIVDIMQVEHSDELAIKILLENGFRVKVLPHTWEVQRFKIEEDAIVTEIVGAFSQYPIMLAWAITIHKSQGKTFEHLVVDLGSHIFSTGQTYVALSRCTSLEGLVLTRPVMRNHIWTDRRIVNFLSDFKMLESTEDPEISQKITLIEKAIQDKSSFKMDYVKADQTETTKTVTPSYIGKMSYHGHDYLGMRAIDEDSNQERAFRVDRIVEISE